MSVLQYASVTEILQFTIAFIGLGLAMWGAWVAFEDAVKLDVEPEDLSRLVALGRMRAQLARISAQGVLVFIGVVSILLPPPARVPVEVIPELIPELEQAALVRIGLMLVTIILTVDAIMERKQRLHFMSRVQLRSHALQDAAVTIGDKEVARGQMHQTK
jgi:hypothetical protein